MKEDADECINIYQRWCKSDDIEGTHEELVKILIGSFISNNNSEDEQNESSYINIIDYICMKLVGIPKYTHHIRIVMSNLETVSELLTSRKIGGIETIMILFSTEEINICIF
jgi:hypothetical protein